MMPKKTILIVDDELGVRESLKMILKHNYQVHTAADGSEALQYIQRGRIDLVTLDLKMPGLPGIEVLQRIKAQDPDIEVVVVTAYYSAQNAEQADQYGAAGVITKPFNALDLMDSVNKTIEKRTLNLRKKNFSLYNSLVTRS